MDVLSASTGVPKLLQNLMTKNTISYGGCIAQIYFLSCCLEAELLLFTAKPMIGSLLPPSICSVGYQWDQCNNKLFIRTVHLSFCGPNVIDHFFCEITPLLPLSRSSAYVNNVMVIMADMLCAVFNFLLILVSYGFIISSILKIRTKEGKKRAFSTCSSHLIVIAMYCCPVIYTYIVPALGQNLKEGKEASVFYTIATPALNPLIYSLRNKDVKIALKTLCTFLGNNWPFGRLIELRTMVL
ncbi:olfactory receptor 13A1-like [Vombatus ursinus]|uniref:olfactory receptor 13A1-like n=1 Tax=Vombatus ursinus TaxID=29139 RepID=UPI000FFD33AC|nr:olfactory receptor 13A1-like [Vombatus ursinus]